MMVTDQHVARQRPGSLGFNITLENIALLLAKNTCADEPSHPCSLISTLVISYLKSKVTCSDISEFCIFYGGLQHDKASGYAPDDVSYQKVDL